MEGVEEIHQMDATHTHWVTRFGGVTREFDATITEQHPDERVAWTSDSGPTTPVSSPSTGSTTRTPG